MLLCSQKGCPGAFHVECLRLERMPKGAWRCAGCSAAGAVGPRRTWKRPKAGAAAPAPPLTAEDFLAEISDGEEVEPGPVLPPPPVFQSDSDSEEAALPPATAAGPPRRSAKGGAQKRARR